MPLSDKDVAGLRADLERVQREKKADAAEYEAKFERLRRERSLGPSFNGLGGGNSSDRRGTAASTMGPMWTRGVSTGGGLGQSLPYVPRGVCLCVFSSHSFWTSIDVPAGVAQEEGNTRFSIHLLSAVLALFFLARRIQPFLSLVDREVEFCVPTI